MAGVGRWAVSDAGRVPYNAGRMKIIAMALAFAWLGQQPPVPRPFPQPGSAAPQRPATPAQPSPAPPARPVAQPPTGGQAAPASQPSQLPAEAAPSEATLGVPVYPGAQFIASYDAGRGQRYYLFGATASFEMLVSYYRTMLKQRGDQVFDVPATYEFDVGRFRDDEMAFPPGVTIKDFQSSLSGGYPNPNPDADPKTFPSIIQIVPVPPQQ
jgi:hypothetical protein